MGNKLSSTSRNKDFPNVIEKQLGLNTSIKSISIDAKEKHFYEILNNFKSVIHSYIGFLQIISSVI